jgi:hypothetical protein
METPRWAIQFSKYIDSVGFDNAGVAWGLAHINDLTDEQHEEVRTLITKEYGQ